MDSSLIHVLQRIFLADSNEQFVLHYSHFLVLGGIATIIVSALGFSPSQTYGRYNRSRVWKIPGSIAWFFQESPAFLLPLLMLLTSACSTSHYNKIVIGLFMFHYFYRSFIYPVAIRKGKPMPLDTFLAATLFCAVNGFAQGCGVICLSQYPSNYFLNIRFILGVTIFAIGLLINMHSDYSLSRLRKPGETSYKIPTGGLFEFVSCANYFGEITEWWGYALVAKCYVATSFAIFTTLFLSTRAYYHHKYYQEKFKNYPSNRKAVIPFIL